DPRWASIAGLMIAAIPTVYDLAGSGYVDLALAAYTALAVRAVARWWTTLDRAWIVPVALAVAGALSIKLTAGFLLLSLSLVVLATLPVAARDVRRSAQRARLCPGAHPSGCQRSAGPAGPLRRGAGYRVPVRPPFSRVGPVPAPAGRGGADRRAGLGRAALLLAVLEPAAQVPAARPSRYRRRGRRGRDGRRRRPARPAFPVARPRRRRGRRSHRPRVVRRAQSRPGGPRRGVPVGLSLAAARLLPLLRADQREPGAGGARVAHQHAAR